MARIDPQRLRRAYDSARAALLAERAPEGHWVGELSTSALSTAVAVSALAMVLRGTGVSPVSDSDRRDACATEALISRGLDWLAAHQNANGGWGDTVKSFSNISTTMLCRAAFHICDAADRFSSPLAKSERWLSERYGRSPEEIAEAVRQRYGKDRTFSVPILMTSALAGLVSWNEVPSLPFELACFPQSWYRFLGLPVVSYALPALIAIGQAVYHHRRPANPLARLVRWSSIGQSLRVLSRIQPSNGGFLEAAPLTGFVALGLASTGKADHPVVQKCVSFLVASVRPDGSWPIDTNLATWVTTLAVNAFAAAGDLDSLDRKDELLAWLLRQQYQERHPFTGADPGAWAWTPLPGAVPDADDTPGALLAVCNLGVPGEWPWGHARNWLLNLQNRDGGWPTFCRGWGKLPFDRSGTDLTAHALRALWRLSLDRDYFERLYGERSRRAFAYLAREQRPDGSWLPLWFGNQHAPDDINPTYGTTRVLAAYRDLELMDTEPAKRGIAWLVANQNNDGGWGGLRGTPSSVEETALAVEVLISWRAGGVSPLSGAQFHISPHTQGADAPRSPKAAAVERGLTWLIDAVEQVRLQEPTPIGFYFAKLWYYEKLYPLVFAVAALGRAVRERA